MDPDSRKMDTLWYVCTACNRAIPEAAESRVHQRQAHGSALSAAGVLILSQTADLTPSVILTRCSSSAFRQNEVKKSPHITFLKPIVRLEPCDSGSSPPRPLSSPEELHAWKGGRIQQQYQKQCNLCRMEFPRSRLLRNHVLLAHASPAFDGTTAFKSEANDQSNISPDGSMEVVEFGSIDQDSALVEVLEEIGDLKTVLDLQQQGCIKRIKAPARRYRRIPTRLPRTDQPLDTIVCNFTNIRIHEISYSRNYFCDSCDFGAYKLKRVQDHVRREHNYQTCSCFVLDCQATFSKRTELGKHLEHAHASGADYWVCTRWKCEMACKTKKELKDHMKIHSKWRRRTRGKGKKPLARVEDQEEAHMELQDDLEVKLEPQDEENESDAFPLSRLRRRQPPCGQRLQSLHYNGVEVSKWLMPEEGIRYCCGVCLSSNPQLSFVAQHIRVAHSALPCSCSVCQAPCANLQELDTHMLQAHEHGVDHTTCLHCKLVFVSKDERRKHTETEHPEIVRGSRKPGAWRTPWLAARSRAATPPSEMEEFPDTPPPAAVPRKVSQVPKCALCFKKVSKRLMEEHNRNEHSEHWKAAEAEEPCECTTCYKDAFLRPSSVLQLCLWSCKLCQARMADISIRAHVRKHHPGQKPRVPSKPGAAEAPPPSEWRAVRLLPTCPVRLAKIQRRCRDCPDCGKTYSSFKYLMVHLKKSHGPTADRTCSVCQRICASRNDLKVHMANMHALNTPAAREHYCTAEPSCPKTFTSEASLRVHMLRHDPANRIYACDVCPGTFLRPGDLARHKEVHGKPSKICPICGKMFRGDFYLAAHHARCHSSDERYKCEQCDQTFSTLVKRRMHAAKHVDGTPFQCSTCPSAYKTEVQLKFHEKCAHKKKIHTCEVCGEGIPGLDALWRHKLTTHGIQPKYKHQCKVCGKSFQGRTNLLIHETKHTTVRPHCCETCGKTFKTVVNLDTHKLTHVPLEELPHLCDQCGTRFRLPHHLRAHRQRIHGELKRKQPRVEQDNSGESA